MSKRLERAKKDIEKALLPLTVLRPIERVIIADVIEHLINVKIDAFIKACNKAKKAKG